MKNGCAEGGKKAAVVGRVIIGLFFLLGGLHKVMDMAGTVGYMEAYNVPAAGVLGWVAAIFLIVSSLMLIAGKKVCLNAALLGAFTLLVTAIFHMDFSEPTQKIMMLKNLAIFGGLLVVMGTCADSCGSGKCGSGEAKEENKEEAAA